MTWLFRWEVRVWGLIAAMLTVVALIGAGCGGGGNGGGASTQAAAGEGAGGNPGGEVASVEGSEGEGGSRKADPAFVKEAEAICEEADAVIRPEIKRYGSKSLGELEKHAAAVVDGTLVPRLKREVAEIRALKQPANAGVTVEPVLAAIEVLIEEAEEEPADVLIKAQSLAKSERVARNHGFSVCGGY